MRDQLVFLIIFVVLLKVFSRPHVGIYLWTWLSLMNPHRLTWGFAHNFPFASIVAGVTIAGILISKQPKRMIWSREVKLLVLFIFWVTLTTLFAFNQEAAQEYLLRVLKIWLFTFFTIYLITDREKLTILIWVTILSLGFWGIKGGVFTLIRGGASHVLGPPGSFIGENNSLALALIMTVPLIAYQFFQEQRKWLRIGLGGAIFFIALSIVGSQSRGALLGLVAMGGFLWLRSKRKALIGALILGVSVTVITIMPQTWWDRMYTIQTYQQDQSAMSRINTWWTCWNVATKNPIGGGFKMLTPDTYLIYAPDPTLVFDSHSIYFQVLGEHGFIGLAIFLAIWICAWFRCGEVVRYCKNSPERKWAFDLASMLQVSMIGYAVSGAFLGLAYFDYYYHLIAIVVITWNLSGTDTRGRQSNGGKGFISQVRA